MKKPILFLISLFSFIIMNAQQQTISIPGEYHLRGVMEVASGFKLNPDSTFDFYFSYGAMDRTGTGRWENKGNRVFFNSVSPKSSHFTLIKTGKDEKGDILITFNSQDPILRSGIYAIIFSGTTKSEPKSGREGEIRFPRQPVDSILLLFEFTPEKTAFFPVADKTANLFTFGFEPWIMDVFFNELSLEVNEKELTGHIPLLKQGEYHFIKK